MNLMKSFRTVCSLTLVLAFFAAVVAVLLAGMPVPDKRAYAGCDDAGAGIACGLSVASAPQVSEALGAGEGEVVRAAEDGSASEAVSPQAVEPVDFAAHVEALLQYPEFPAGCESAALAVALRSMGFEVALGEIVEGYLPIDPSRTDFVNAFGGDPRSGGGAYAPALVRTANAYLADHGSDRVAHDLTGASFDELLEWVRAGYPVLVWTTMYGAEPAFTGQTFEGREWYSNEHCVVLYGIDPDTGALSVSDSLEGLVTRDAASFERLYEACGSMALVIA